MASNSSTVRKRKLLHEDDAEDRAKSHSREASVVVLDDHDSSFPRGNHSSTYANNENNNHDTQPIRRVSPETLPLGQDTSEGRDSGVAPHSSKEDQQEQQEESTTVPPRNTAGPRFPCNDICMFFKSKPPAQPSRVGISNNNKNNRKDDTKVLRNAMVCVANHLGDKTAIVAIEEDKDDDLAAAHILHSVFNSSVSSSKRRENNETTDYRTMTPVQIAMATRINPTKRPGKDVTTHNLNASSQSGIRDLAQTHSQKLLQLLKDECHAVANPNGIFSEAIFGTQDDDDFVGKNQGIVYEFDGKIGSTMHFKNRRIYYAMLFFGDASRWPEIKLNILCRMDKSMSMETDKRAKKIIQAFLQDVVDHPSLPKPICDFFSVILNQHGGKIGLNRQLLLQMIEIGCQHQFDMPVGAMYDACMFDKAVFERQQAWVLAAKDKVCSLIPNGRYRGSEAMLAWNTGRKDCIFSTTVVVTEAVLSSKGNWADARPHAVYPDATTREEIFSTDYSDTENQDAVARIVQYIQGASSSMNIRYLDRNSDLVEQTELRLNALLRNQGFSKQFVLFGGFVEVYYDGDKTLLIVHGALCGSGDSRSFKSQDAIMVANMSAALLQQITLHVTGGMCMPQNSQPENDPLTAGYIFQATRKGFHQHSKTAAAMHRQYLSGTDQDAIGQGSRLPGHDADDEMPLGNNNRKVFHGNKHSKDSSVARPVHAAIVDQGMNLLTHVATNSKIEIHFAVKKVDNLFKSTTGNTAGGALYGRWAYLYERLSKCGTTACLDTLNAIKTAEKSLRENAGNTNQHDGQGDEHHVSNNDELEAKLADIQKHGMRMRIRRYKAAKGADKNKLPVFRGCHLPVIGRTSLDGIKTRLKNSRNPKKKQRRGIKGLDLAQFGTKASNIHHDVIVDNERWCILQLVPVNSKISEDNKARSKKRKIIHSH